MSCSFAPSFSFERPAQTAGDFRRSVRQRPYGRWFMREAGAAPHYPHGVAPPPASAANPLPRRYRSSPLTETVAVVALATLLGTATAGAQTMQDRARAAAEAARAKSSDSDAIQRNYLTPGLSGRPIATVDNSTSFAPNLACQKTATMLEILVQPAPGGDLGTVSIARDTDLDGSIDTRANLPVPVSGICANGVIACDPGSWNACRYFRWDVDQARALKLTQVAMPELAGCYCINNSCGTNLVWGNMPSVLRDLGGGMVGALTTADARYGVAEAVIDGPMIRYVGAQSTACTTNPSLPQTSYRASPSAIASDAFVASSSNSLFQALKGSAIGTGTALQYRHCTIERRVTVLETGARDIIERVAGGYATQADGTSLDFLMGSPDNDSLIGGSCNLFDFRMTLHVADASRLTAARLVHWFADDWGQVRIDGTIVASGPTPWNTMGLPPGKCEKRATYQQFPDLDLKPYLTNGDHEIWLRAGVAGGGEAFAQIHAEIDTSCRTIEQVVDQCASTDADPQCRIDSELVDGVQTFINSVATGLRPLVQTRVMGSQSCPVELSRDFFLKDRTYRCQLASISPPDTSRGAYIIDHSTESLLADRIRQPDGSVATSERPFALPDRGAVPACEAVCKTRAPRVNADAAPDGVVGTKQNDPTGYDSFYHACDGTNRCPMAPGEELVSGCGCLDDFPEAVVMMQTVRLAGADLVCTGTTP